MAKRQKEGEEDGEETIMGRVKQKKSFVATVKGALRWKEEVKAEPILWTCNFCARQTSDRLECVGCHYTFCPLCLLNKDRMVCFDCNDRCR